MNKKKIMTILLAALILFSSGLCLFPETSRISVSAFLNWERGELEAVMNLDLSSTGLRFPSGRNRAEEILKEEYLDYVRPFLLPLQVDSSSTVEDLIRRGDLTLRNLDAICLGARIVPPSFSADMTHFTGRYNVFLNHLSAALIRHRQAVEANRPLIPTPSANYTGIIIMADSMLPIHGRNTSALVQPCLFPKIWDTEMNLVYERNLTDPAFTGSGNTLMAHYTGPESIFRPTPSGLNEDLIKLVGERPLRVFAHSVYGITPTDLVIDKADAQLILSNENNRRLLRECRVVVVINESFLRNPLSSF